MTKAREYADWVLAPENEIKTGRLIKLAAQRFLSDLERDDIYFDEEQAVIMVNFAERYCKQWEGDWQGLPFIMEPWQRFHLEQLFGWIRKDTGTRRFTKFYLQISKKNGKSSECAVLSLFHLFADDRVNTPKVFTAANNEDQAKICVNMAGRMIEQSEDLNDYVIDEEVKLSTYGKNITEVIHKTRKGFITALSKEGGDKTAKTAGGKHGINASMGLVDEFSMSPDHGASGSISTSMAARKERLMAYLTTSGFNKGGPCFVELRGQGIQVLEGIIKMDHYLPIIYEIDKPLNEDGKPEEPSIDYLLAHPEVWQQSNPNLGVSVNREYLEEMLLAAKTSGGTTEVEVKTLNFNIWCDTPDVWISQDVWAKNSHGIDLGELIGRTCYAGIEIPSGMSVACISLFFPDLPAGKHAVRCMFWAPSDLVKLAKEHVSLPVWAQDGHIEVCEGNVIDNDYIFNKVVALFNLYHVHSLAFNATVQNHDIIQALVRNGLNCQVIQTGYKTQNLPTTEWQAMLTGAQLEHFNNPVLTWMNSQTQVNRNKETEIRIQKADWRTSGITASVNALAQWKSIMASEPQDSIIESW